MVENILYFPHIFNLKVFLISPPHRIPQNKTVFPNGVIDTLWKQAYHSFTMLTLLSHFGHMPSKPPFISSTVYQLRSLITTVHIPFSTAKHQPTTNSNPLDAYVIRGFARRQDPNFTLAQKNAYS